MSTETPVLRNFKGLDDLQLLLDSARLVVNQGHGQVSALEPGDTQTLSPADLRDVGLSIRFDNSDLPIAVALERARLSKEDVDLVVLAESGFLKDRAVLVNVPVATLTSSTQIVMHKGTRHDALNDKRHGFDVQVLFVLNKTIPPMQLRPRRLGTILADIAFTIRPNRMGNGLVPRPLTAEVRADRAPVGTVLWVESNGDLLTAETLDEAVTIYIDEEIHSDIGRLRTKEAKLLQVTFALEALGHIVHLVSGELQDHEITSQDEKSVVVDFLHAQLERVVGSKAGSKKDVLVKIKSDPSLVAAQLTAQHNFKKSLRTLLVDEEEQK
jgi:hypothetical protein